MQLINENNVEAFKNALPRVNVESCSSGKDSDGCTLMQLAVIKDKADFVEALLDANIDGNIGEGGQKPLLLAAKLGRDEILKLFMNCSQKGNRSPEAKSTCTIDFDVCTRAREDLYGKIIPTEIEGTEILIPYRIIYSLIHIYYFTKLRIMNRIIDFILSICRTWIRTVSFEIRMEDVWRRKRFAFR